MQIERVGFMPHPVNYLAAWQMQREVHAAVVAGESPDTTLLLEHDAVYTAGKRTEPHERPSDGTPVVDVDRGGKITWHGPGQLTGYPIMRLPSPVDVVAHVRRLEDVMMGVCAEFGVPAQRIEGRSGVWLRADSTGGSDRKVGAIGIRVSRDVTMHGFALNCDCDLSWAEPIVPCGIADAGVTSLSHELSRPVSVSDALPLVERHLHRVFDTV
ncbi:MAG: lipoyl(octanoyl) transferase LipB [Ornithinimicrobium sp.]